MYPNPLTPDELKAQMEAKRHELDAWAEQNGIDPQYLMGPKIKIFKDGMKIEATAAN